jgi:hypothetical protein
MPGGFCLFLCQTWKKLPGFGKDSKFYAANGVQISLGDRFRVSRKSPGYHVVRELVS